MYMLLSKQTLMKYTNVMSAEIGYECGDRLRVRRLVSYVCLATRLVPISQLLVTSKHTLPGQIPSYKFGYSTSNSPHGRPQRIFIGCAGL
jgi:hypothetical protein